MSLPYVVYVHAKSQGAKLWLKTNFDQLAASFRELHSDTLHRLKLDTHFVPGIVLHEDPEVFPRIELTVHGYEHARQTARQIRQAIARSGGNVADFDVGRYRLDVVA